MKIAAVLVSLGVVLAAVPANADETHKHDHAKHEMHAPQGNDAAEAFEQANEKMHKDMAIELTGDADVDFVRGMIPHHQGAIDMAKVVLKYGKDPDVRKLAEEIIKAQDSEIAFMKSWLAKQGK